MDCSRTPQEIPRLSGPRTNAPPHTPDVLPDGKYADGKFQGPALSTRNAMWATCLSNRTKKGEKEPGENNFVCVFYLTRYMRNISTCPWNQQLLMSILRSFYRTKSSKSGVNLTPQHISFWTSHVFNAEEPHMARGTAGGDGLAMDLGVWLPHSWDSELQLTAQLAVKTPDSEARLQGSDTSSRTSQVQL